LSLAFTADNSMLATGSADKTGRLWRIPSGDEFLRVEANARVSSVAVSADFRTLVTGSRDDTVVKVWSVADRRLIAMLPHQIRIDAVRLSPDGSLLAVADGPNIQTWETHGWQQLGRSAHEAPITAMAFQPGTGRLATASLDRTARLWDPKTGREMMRWGYEDMVQDLGFSRDGRFLTTASLDGSADVLDVSGSAGVDRLPVGKSPTSLSYSPDGGRIAVGAADGSVTLVDANAPRRLRAVTFDNNVNAVAFSRSGRYMAVGGRERVVTVLAADDGHMVATLSQSAAIASVMFSHDDGFLATAGDDRIVRLWRTDTWQQARRGRAHPTTPFAKLLLDPVRALTMALAHLADPDTALYLTYHSSTERLARIAHGL
jgi:WD40 repeat protein